MKQYLAGLPTKTEEEVLKHIGWYVEYQSLLSKKKEAILKWRQVKDVCANLTYYLYHLSSVVVVVQSCSG